MKSNSSTNSRFKNLKIAITGAKGSLGSSLIQELKNKGAYVVGLTHRTKNENVSNIGSQKDWIFWSCGEEKQLTKKLGNFDILILNHGFNPKGGNDSEEINKSIEINALSHWRLMQIFEDLAIKESRDLKSKKKQKEIWVNTSEAEIQIAFSPLYEITKHFIGELVSLKKINLLMEDNQYLIIKKIILGPFKSKLNPQGIMSADFVAKKVINLAETKKRYLIIVTPNLLTYLLMPITELLRNFYSIFIKIIYKK